MQLVLCTMALMLAAAPSEGENAPRAESAGSSSLQAADAGLGPEAPDPSQDAGTESKNAIAVDPAPEAPDPSTVTPDAGAPPMPIFTTTVTSQRGLAIGEAATASNLIAPREVETTPARTSDELLRSVAEVQMPRAQSAFEHPTAQSVSMRGVGGGRTLVLMDGIPVNDAFGSWILWNKIPLAEVERVEVVRGAAANVYGNLAMGGVIQLFRRPADATRLNVVGEYGTQNTYRVGADGTWKINDVVALTVFGQSMKSDGFIVVAPQTRGLVDRPEPFQANNVGLRLDIHPISTLSLFAQADYYQEARTAGTALTVNGISLWEGSAGMDYRPEPDTLVRVRVFGSSQEYTNVNSTIAPDRSSETPAIHNRVPSSRLGGSALWSHKLGAQHALTFGLDVQQLSAINYDLVFNSSGVALGNRVAGGKQLLLGLFGEWSYTPSSHWTLTAGLRGDLWRNYDGGTIDLSGAIGTLATRMDGTATPRLTAVYRIIDSLALRAGVYTGFRAPTPNELYRTFVANGVTFLPNSGLTAERLVGGEIGVDWSPFQRLRLGVTGYMNELFGMVQSVTLDATTSQRQNLGEARTGGIEADARWRPIQPLTFIASYAFTHTGVISSVANPALVGRRLPSQPLHRGSVTVQFDKPEWFTASARVWSESVAYSDDRNRFVLPAFAVVDLSVAREVFRDLEVYASVTNLLNSQVVTSQSLTTTSIGSPRTAWVGIRLKLRGAP